MSRYLDPEESTRPYRDPTPLPADVPKVKELGVTSAPLKSAAFFLGAFCKDYNGACYLETSLCAVEGKVGQLDRLGDLVTLGNVKTGRVAISEADPYFFLGM